MKALTPEDPQWLGRNRMLAVIGRGGMGRVLLGRTPTGRLVAVKQIHPHLASDPEFQSRFEREVSASRQVTGAYAAAVVDSHTESETPWLATEYIPGPDLGTVIETCGPLNLGGLRLLAVGLALALEELHRAGLVHRDLKPGNVLLTPEGPRVIDFGIARSLENDSKMTATGSVVGSPAYMSPEQAEGRELTAAADVFSVGAILAMAATGSSPFPGNSTPQILYSVMRSTPELDQVPPSLHDLVAACLAKNPEERPTARELLEAAGRIPSDPVWSQPVLERISAHRAEADWWVDAAAKQAEQQERLERIRERRRRVLRTVAAAAVSVLVIVGGGVAAYQWAQMPGHAEPMVDPSLALTADELRLIDTCELLDTAVAGKLGSRTGDLEESSVGCTTQITSDSKRKTKYTLEVGTSRWDSEPSRTRTGKFAGWTPILGDKVQGRDCSRSVINQSVARAEILVRVLAPDNGGCADAEQALQAVVQRLLVYVPMRQRLPESILRVDPCSMVDFEVSLGIAGDPAERSAYPHRCSVDGSDASLDVELNERVRPDDPSKIKAPFTVPVGEYTAYVNEIEPFTLCELSYLVRPTTGKLGEVVTVTVDNYTEKPDACERATALLADVIPRLPKS